MSPKWKLAAVAVGLIIFLLSMLALLQIHRFKQLLIEVTSSLVSVPSQSLKRDVERTLAFGLPLRDNSQLKVMLKEVLEENKSIVSIHLIDADADAGKVLWESGPPLKEPKRVIAAQRRNPKAMLFDDKDPSGFIQSWPITDPIGHMVANLTVRFDKTKPMALVADAASYLVYVWAGLSLASLLILLPAVFYLLSQLDRAIARAKSIILGTGNPDAHQVECDSDIGRLALRIAEAGKGVPVERN